MPRRRGIELQMGAVSHNNMYMATSAATTTYKWLARKKTSHLKTTHTQTNC